MSKKISILSSSVLTLFFIFCAYGQNDPVSQKIIDDMTARFKTFQSVAVNFSFVVINIQNNSETEPNDGKLWVKGEKYKLDLPPEYVIYFDGDKIYQYLPTVNEVNIARPDLDDDDEFQLLNPQSYFNISSKIFRSNLVRESTHDRRAVYEIDLYPVNLQTSNFSRIRIMVEKSTLQLVYSRVFMKNATQYSLSFKPYEILRTPLGDSFFVFNRNDYPNVEVIDLTF